LKFCTLKLLSSPNRKEISGVRENVALPVETKRLLSLAYGYLGSLVEGEDIVQEALLRFAQSNNESIHNVEAWLTTVVTRLCIDKLRSAQHRREVYPGEWLPEPVFNAPTPEQDAITRSRLSVGLLYLLEKLEPEQRVVFILREVFEHSYQSIAEIAGKSEAACRQLMVRARAALDRARKVPLRPEPLRTPSSVASSTHLQMATRRHYSGSLQTTLCWWGMEAAKCLRSSILCMGPIALPDSFWACFARNATYLRYYARPL